MKRYNFLDIINISHGIITIKCDKCNKEYNINTAVLNHRVNLKVECCTICNPVGSFNISEDNVGTYIESLKLECSFNRRDLMNDKKEIDVYIDNKKIGIEYNGLLWHSNKFVNDSYHINKTNSCNENGIDLIHIFEDEWINKQDIIKSLLKEFLDIDSLNLSIDNIIIKEIHGDEVRCFMDNNDLNGYINSSINLGIFTNDELITLLSIDNDDNNNYNIVRMTNKINKNNKYGYKLLIDYFIKIYNPNKLTCIIDNRFLFGKILGDIGFNKVSISSPNKWFLIKEGKNRIYTRVSSDMNGNSNYIYDCGNSEYELILK